MPNRLSETKELCASTRQLAHRSRELSAQSRVISQEINDLVQSTQDHIDRSNTIIEDLSLELLPRCDQTRKISHATIVSAQSHCNRLKEIEPNKCYRWYVCEHSHGMQHYHVATSNASTGSLLRSGEGMYQPERRKPTRTELQGGLGNMLVQIVRRMKADRGCIFVYNPGVEKLEMRFAYGMPVEVVTKFYYLPLDGQTASSMAFTDRKMIMHIDVDATAPTYRALAQSQGINAVLVMPLIYDTTAVGTISLIFNTTHQASQIELYRLRGFSSCLARTIVGEAKLEAESMSAASGA